MHKLFNKILHSQYRNKKKIAGIRNVSQKLILHSAVQVSYNEYNAFGVYSVQSTGNNRTVESATVLWSPNNYHVKTKMFKH
jgi:hypothetical protein